MLVRNPRTLIISAALLLSASAFTAPPAAAAPPAKPAKPGPGPAPKPKLDLPGLQKSLESGDSAQVLGAPFLYFSVLQVFTNEAQTVPAV